MQKKYKGILINCKIYKENDLFIKFLSETDEILSGIVYGGLSRKKKLIYQVGYYLEFIVSYKSNRPLSINAELIKPFIFPIIENKYKLNCLISIASLINLSIVEGQKIKNIYHITDEFLLKMFNNKKWFKHFCIFLFNPLFLSFEQKILVLLSCHTIALYIGFPVFLFHSIVVSL